MNIYVDAICFTASNHPGVLLSLLPGAVEVPGGTWLCSPLSFVPLDDLDLAWRLLEPTIPSDMEEFVAYFENTWVGTSAKPPTFDPWSWNHHDSVICGLPRSSNIAEGWHNGFKTLVACANPTMWRFLDCLKLEQGEVFAICS